MNYQIVTLILSLLVFTSYVAYVTIKFGWLRNISVSYYHIKAKWLFALVLSAFPILLSIAGDSAFLFTGSGAICCAGVAADGRFREKITNTVHDICSKLGVIFGMLALIFSFGLWYFALFLLIFICLAAIYRHKIKNYVFWIEVAAYYVVWTGVLINLIK